MALSYFEGVGAAAIVGRGVGEGGGAVLFSVFGVVIVGRILS